ncbi:MAG: nitrogen regulation protein NR(I) [Magnetococcales bacterium]|nr:nitrogen regulation protein NR(I) [Magnetococcales bacterium]NGZ27592.1 nitrogen regulation protein NR(I) [Magnetococcales bacterium]
MEKAVMTPTSSGSVLIADDDQAVRFVLEQALRRAGMQAKSFVDGRSLLDYLSGHGADLVITDIVMPSGSGLDLLKTIKSSHPLLPVIVITAQSTLLNAVQAFERGAFEYLPKPFDINQVVDLARRAMERTRPSGEHPMDMERFGGIIGSSLAMQELFRTIGRLAHSEMTVLIHGESGTGKELVARAVHAYSPRRSGPFVAINMAAIPRELIESELFGHEKGAFTGAVSRRHGHFERAQGGALFLDEIGDMPMEAQTRLLRVLQDGTYTRVGGAEILPANVRIIAATHQDLPAAIAAGRFREDLFYRLNVIPLHVPSLRSRREDIPLLADYFIAKTAKELNIPLKRLDPQAMDKLLAWDWPGNVRELENLIRRLMVLVPDGVVRPDHPELPSRKTTSQATPVAPAPSTATTAGEIAPENPLQLAVMNELDRFFATLNGLETTNLYDTILNQVEPPLIQRVLRETRGNQVKAAIMLGINRNTLRKKILEFGLDPKK